MAEIESILKIGGGSLIVGVTVDPSSLTPPETAYAAAIEVIEGEYTGRSWEDTSPNACEGLSYWIKKMFSEYYCTTIERTDKDGIKTFIFTITPP